MITGIDHQSLDPPNIPIRGVDVVATLHLDLTRGYAVRGDCLGPRTQVLHPHANHPHAAQAATQARSEAWPEAPLATSSGRKGDLIRFLERLELRHGAPQPDLLPSHLDEIDRDKSTHISPMSRFDGEMGYLADRRIDD